MKNLDLSIMGERRRESVGVSSWSSGLRARGYHELAGTAALRGRYDAIGYAAERVRRSHELIDTYRTLYLEGP